MFLSILLFFTYVVLKSYMANKCFKMLNLIFVKGYELVNFISVYDVVSQLV